MREEDPPSVSLPAEPAATAESGRSTIEPETLLRSFAEVTDDAIYAKDRRGRYLFANPAAALFLGRPVEEILGKDDRELFPPETAKAVMTNDRRVMESGRTETLEHAVAAAGATRVFLSTRGPLRDSRGNILGIVGISRDITARKRGEDELQLSEERFSRAFHASPVATSISELETGRILDVNDRFCGLLGYGREEVLGRTSLEIGLWAEPARRTEMAEIVGRAGFARDQEAVLRTRSGEARTVLASMERIELHGRACILAIFDDITDRKRSQRELEEFLRREQAARQAAQESEQAQRFLAQASRILSSSLNYELTLGSVADLAVPRIADWCEVDLQEENGAIEQLAVSHVDSSKAELARQMRRQFPLRPDDPAGPVHVVRTGQPEWLEETPDSLLVATARNEEHLGILRTLGFASSMCVPMTAHGEVIGALTFVTSESGRRYGPADFQLAQQLASLAAMAVVNARLYRDAQQAIRHRDNFLSIAGHELKTPLTTLQLEVQRLLRLAQAGEPPARLIERAEKTQHSIARLTRLIDELLDVSRISAGRLALDRERTDLSRIVREVADRAAEELARAGSPLTVETEPGIEGVWDRRRLEQVVGNLLSNAIKYGQGRPIQIETRREGEAAWLVVRDQGLGILEADQARIFQRFERAVSERHFGGFGLGLWIVGQIVEALGGRIEVSSQPGSGSTFRVWLPLRPPENAVEGR